MKKDENVYPVLQEWKHFLMMYKFAIDEVHTKLTILSKEFHHSHDHNPIEHLKTRVKNPKSISAKLKRKGYEATTGNAAEYIQDIAGIRITCPFVSDIYTLHQLLEDQQDIQVIEIKDYVKKPKPNGYQSYHMIIEIPVFLSDRTKFVLVEIQIRTIAMDFWATLEHKMFYKYDKEVTISLANELKDAAETVQYLDQKMEVINNHIGQTDAKVIPFDPSKISEQRTFGEY